MLLWEIDSQDNLHTGQLRSHDSPSRPGLASGQLIHLHFSGSTTGYLETVRPLIYTMEVASRFFLPFLHFYYFFEAYCLWEKWDPHLLIEWERFMGTTYM